MYNWLICLPSNFFRFANTYGNHPQHERNYKTSWKLQGQSLGFRFGTIDYVFLGDLSESPEVL
jgi:hypothetical protein